MTTHTSSWFDKLPYLYSHHTTVSKVDKFEPTMWWTASFLIGMRVMQTSLMVFITRPSLQASVACLIALIGIAVQQRNAPYRRPSE